MSLSKEAIDTITATAIAANGIPLPTHRPALLVPSGYAIQTIEHLQAHPVRHRGAFTTTDIHDFVHYVKQHANGVRSAGFINRENMTARVIFDLGDAQHPGFGDHTATITLMSTAPYEAICTASSRHHSQDSLVQFIEDWLPHIKAYGEAGDSILPAAAIHAIRHMRFETKGEREHLIGDFSAKKSAMEAIEAKSQGSLPHAFEFSCIPYEHLDPVTIRLRLAVLTGNEAPTFRLRWIAQEAQTVTPARNFKEVLAEELDATITMLVGQFIHKD